MKILALQGNDKQFQKVYSVSSKVACNYINWLDSEFPFEDEYISKGNYYAVSEKACVWYDFHNHLLTVSMRKK